MSDQGGKKMEISVNHRVVKDFNQLKELVTDEVAAFCLQWKKGLDQLLNEKVHLFVYMRRYGYEVKYHFENGGLNWLFQLELYYPNQYSNHERKIQYLKIHKFATIPMYQGSGPQVFAHLLDCTKLLSELVMIRLRSVRSAIYFWKKQGFEELIGDKMRDENLPQGLSQCNFIYPIKQ